MRTKLLGTIIGLAMLVFVGMPAGAASGQASDSTTAPVTTGVGVLHHGAKPCHWSTATILGSTHDDELVGTPGDDIIRGGPGDDLLYGMGGEDVVCGNGGADVLYGDGDGSPSHPNTGAGDDLLLGDAGNDALRGGPGIDQADYDYAPAGVTADLSAQTALHDGYGTTDLLVGMENIGGSDFNDRLRGDVLDNSVWGGTGSDELRGGAGSDTADFSEAPGPMEVDLADATARGQGIDKIASFENVIGSPAGDQLLGTNGDNVMLGLGGNDEIIALNGNDTVTGGAGLDQLYGGLGADVLEALDGEADTVDGGGDTDTCNADAVIDTVVSCP